MPSIKTALLLTAAVAVLESIPLSAQDRNKKKPARSHHHEPPSGANFERWIQGYVNSHEGTIADCLDDANQSLATAHSLEGAERKAEEAHWYAVIDYLRAMQPRRRAFGGGSR